MNDHNETWQERMNMPSRHEFFHSLQRKAANLNNPTTAATSREQCLLAHVRTELATERQRPQCDLTAVREYRRLLHRLARAVDLPP
jgi:hypothetical protein